VAADVTQTSRKDSSLVIAYRKLSRELIFVNFYQRDVAADVIFALGPDVRNVKVMALWIRPLSLSLTHTHARAFMYTHTHTCICVHTHTHIHVLAQRVLAQMQSKQVLPHTDKFTHEHTYIVAFSCLKYARTRSDAHTCTHTYTHVLAELSDVRAGTLSYTAIRTHKHTHVMA